MRWRASQPVGVEVPSTYIFNKYNIGFVRIGLKGRFEELKAQF